MLEGYWKSCYDFRWLLSRKDATLKQAAGHLTVLAVALTIARVAAIGPMLLRMIDTGAAYVAKEMPEVRIENGKASTDAKQPWSRSFEGQFQLIIDTTGQTQGIDAAYPTGVLIAADKIVYKRGPDTSQSIDLSKVQSFSTRGPKMTEMLDAVRGWVYPALLPMIAGLSAAGLLIRWLLMASFALWIAEPMGSPLRWEGILRIGAYATTPAVYFILIGTLTPLSVALVPTLAQAFFLGMPLWIAKEDAEGSGGDSANGYHKPAE
jgi:hypothetical protein